MGSEMCIRDSFEAETVALDAALGRVTAPDFYANKYAWLKSRWVFAGRGWVDPVKEATAAKLRLDANISTLELENAEQGLDWEDVLEQRARESAQLESLGLPASAAASAPADKQDTTDD